jgi:ligand-binding sensor domain-containing protein
MLHRLILILLAFFLLFNIGMFRCRQPAKESEFPFPVFRQIPNTVVPEAPSHLVFDHFTEEDGLCGNEITHLFQDRSGFLWIGTETGLNRYDGYSFRVYRHDKQNPASLPGNQVFCIDEDSRGSIWVLTAKGLSKLHADGGFESHFDSLTIQDINGNVSRMEIDAKDRIWLRCNNSLTYFDPALNRFIKTTNFGATPFLDKNGGLIAFGCRVSQSDSLVHHKVLRWNDLTAQFDEVKDTIVDNINYHDLNFNDGAFDGKGNVWFCRQNGWLLHYDVNANQFTYHPPLPNVPLRYNLGSSMPGMCASQSGDVLWIGSFRGLIRYDLKPHARVPVIRYEQNESEPKGLPDRVVTDVLEDRAGNLWVGLMSGGLCRYAPSSHKFQVFTQKTGDSASLASNRVEALRYDQTGRLWIGTNKGLSVLKDRYEGSFANFIHPEDRQAKGEWIYDMAMDSASGKIYLAYWGRIPDAFDPGKNTFQPLQTTNLPKGMLENWCDSYISSIVNDRKGNVFYGTWSGGVLQKYNINSRRFTWYGWKNWQDAQKAGFVSSQITKAYPTNDGLLWLANDQDAGLMCVDFSKIKTPVQVFSEDKSCPLQLETLDGALHNFLPIPGDSSALQSGSVNDMLEDRKGRLWVGTHAGLHCLKDRQKGAFQYFGTAAGFPDEPIFSIVEDMQGRLWIGTNKGLCCFDPSLGKVTATYFVNDGLPSNTFLLQACARGPQGELAFGTAKGLCIFHPDSLFMNTHPPEIELIELKANQVLQRLTDKKIKLPYDSSNLFIRFAALDFSNPNKNLFQYQLIGFDKSPSPLGSQNTALYPNLPAGKYEFKVIGTNNDGVPSDSELTIFITILPPWWLTWQFKSILAALFCAMIYSWVKWRELNIRREKDNERKIKYLQIQTLQAQMNPHFIFNVLGTMQNRILNSSPQEANRQLVNLSELIRLFLDSSVNSAPPGKGISNHEIPLQKELDLLEMYAGFEVLQKKEKFKGNGFEITVHPSVNVATMRIPPMIIQPYVENAIKHGIGYLTENHQGFISIHFSKNDDLLRCVVTDNGVGREEAMRIQQQSRHLYVSYGTRLVKERAEILNQMDYDIAISTQDRPEGRGTIVTITIKD